MRSSEELHKKHQELWGWLAETGSEFKDQWPGWEDEDHIIAYEEQCFACEAVNIAYASRSRTCGSHCPVSWNGRHCCFRGAEYSQWLACESEDGRKKLAAIIRDLPWAEYWEFRRRRMYDQESLTG